MTPLLAKEASSFHSLRMTLLILSLPIFDSSFLADELARTAYSLASQGHVMTDLPQHQENGQLFDLNHYANINALMASHCQHQDAHFVQNYQLPEQVSMFQNQNDAFGAANVSDNLLGDFVNNWTASDSFLAHMVNDDSLNDTVDRFQKPKALVQGMAWAFISLRMPRSQRMPSLCV